MSEFPWDEPDNEAGAEADFQPEPEAEAKPEPETAPADAGETDDDASADDVATDSEPVVPRRSEGGTRPLVRKEYYAISEVADLVGLPAHVLRYWESQFAVLNPSKNRSGNRVYQRKEIRLILLVKQLLYDEKYTVEGAKQKLDQLRRGGGLQEATSGALNEQLVQVLRDELHAVAELLAPDAG
ncbi:hypothetical protein BH23GEM10_BH23GEM10_06520 [soil metagenome]